LQAGQDGFYFIQLQRIIIVGFRQSAVYLFHRAGEIALVVYRIHEGMGNGLVTLAQWRQVQLPLQVVPQGFRGRVSGFEIVITVVVIAGRRGWAGLVNIIPGGIDGQVIGNSVGGAFRQSLIGRFFGSALLLLTGVGVCRRSLLFVFL